MKTHTQFGSPLFWVPLMLAAAGFTFSLYADGQTKPGHLGESFAMNAGALFVGTLVICLVCGILLLTRRLFLPSFTLLAMVVYFFFRLFI